jgi:hypothetical protein
MKKIPLGFLISAASLALPIFASAQSVSPLPKPSPTPARPVAKSKAPTATLVATPAASKPEEKKFYDKLKMSYSLDYDGPRFSDFDPSKTQAADGSPADFTAIAHTLKVGYTLSKKVILGLQFGGLSSLKPGGGFSFGDIASYLNWSKMVETPDLEMQGVLKIGYPTTAASQTGPNARIMSVQARGNWTLKTALRNWSFTAATKFTSTFYKYANVSRPDFTVSLEPYITVDVTPNIAWVFQASFDAAHSYNDTTFDFNQGDGDRIDTGPSFTLSSHANLTPVIGFYTQNPSFNTAILSVDLTFVL